MNQSFVLTVYQAPVIATIGNTTITKGVAMTPVPITATGYPVPKLAASGLPRGIKLTLGSIAGTTSAAAGAYTVKITASGKAGSPPRPSPWSSTHSQAAASYAPLICGMGHPK